MKLETRKLSELKDFPRNPRTIKEDELNALKRSIQEFGTVQPLVVNDKGEVIGGNQRLRAMKELGIESTEVVVVNLPIKKELALNLALNRIHGSWNMPSLQQVMTDLDKDDLGLSGFSDAEVKAMLSTVEVSDKTLKQITQEMIAPPIEEVLEEGPHQVTAQDYGGGFVTPESEKILLGLDAAAKGVPDAMFPSEGTWEIPILRADMCAELIQAPVLVYGATHRIDKITGTWLFYCYDAQFEELWKNPDKISTTAAYGVGELNFSSTPQTPRAIVLYNIYRKRWLSRYWQERGMRIVVDMNMIPRDFDIALLGVPKGWSTFSTRGCNDHLDYLEQQYDFAREWCGRDPLFLVYGGGNAVRALCKERGWLHIDEGENAIRAGKLINNHESGGE